LPEATPAPTNLVVFARWRPYVPPSHILFPALTRVCPTHPNTSLGSAIFTELTSVTYTNGQTDTQTAVRQCMDRNNQHLAVLAVVAMRPRWDGQ